MDTQVMVSRHRLNLSISLLALCLLILMGSAWAGEPTAETSNGDSSPAHAAFEQLKGLAGTWNGDDSHRHHITLSAGGTVVKEIMMPGTEHEMINMYFLDGERLLLTHYCAGGNQPQMELQPQTAANTLHFDFIGGTNLDPAVDSHIHAAKIVMVDQDTLESSWTGYQDGKPHHDMVFHLKRQGG